MLQYPEESRPISQTENNRHVHPLQFHSSDSTKCPKIKILQLTTLIYVETQNTHTLKKKVNRYEQKISLQRFFFAMSLHPLDSAFILNKVQHIEYRIVSGASPLSPLGQPSWGVGGGASKHKTQSCVWPINTQLPPLAFDYSAFPT